MQQKITKTKDMILVQINGTHTARGAEAFFYRLGRSKYGLKLFKSHKLARQVFERQKIAADAGVAPFVGKFVIAKKPGQTTLWYGYQTEKASEVFYGDPIWTKQSKSLQKKLKKLGMDGDFADVNCGVWKRKLVAVDFGSHSAYDS